MSKTKTIRTWGEMAGKLKVDDATLRRWAKREDWRFRRSPPWPVDDVPKMIRWQAETIVTGRPSGKVEQSGPMADLRRQKLAAEVRKLLAQADQAETALAKERGALLVADDVAREWAAVGATVRNALEGITSQIVPLALNSGMPHEAAPIYAAQVEDLIRGVLQHLSETGEAQTELELTKGTNEIGTVQHAS